MLPIGTFTNEPDRLATLDLGGLLHHTLVVGQSGSGKSFFVARLVEEILTRTRARVVALDPNGDFRTFSEATTSWSQLAARRQSLADLCLRDGLTVLDEEAAFREAWSARRFVYLVADKLAPLWPTNPSARVAHQRLVVHWDDLEEEREFLLKADAGQQPNLLLGLKACQEYLTYLHAERDTAVDLRSLIAAAESFANRRIAVGMHYEYATSLDAADWNAVRAAFFDLLRTYTLWWSQTGRTAVRRPLGLADYVDAAFARSRGPSDWDVLTLNLDSATREDALLAADVLLMRLWRNAKQAWRDRMAGRTSGAEVDRWAPTFVVVDEAHNFAPAETGGNALRQRVSERLLQIASEGRKYGLYLILATQRPTKLHPELVPECENSCVLRVQSAAEQSFAASVLGIQESFAQTVARFTQGQGLLSGRWTHGETWDAKAAPARTAVGGGGLGDTWKASPSTEPWWPEVAAGEPTLAPTLSDVRHVIEERLRASPTPVALVDLANTVVAEKPDAGPTSQWLGTGGFKALLGRLSVPSLRLRTDIPPGLAYIEGLHEPPGAPHSEGETVRNGPDVAFGPPIAVRVSEAFGVPRLTSEEYAALFTAIEEHFGGEADFELSRTRLVRDAVAAQGFAISRHAVNYVVKGIYFAGHDFSADVAQDAGTLGVAFLANVTKMIRQEGMEVSASDETALELWLTGAAVLGEALEPEEGAEADVMPGKDVGIASADPTTEDAGRTVDGDYSAVRDDSSPDASDDPAVEDAKGSEGETR